MARMRGSKRWLIVGVGGLVVVVGLLFGGIWLYNNVIDKPPKRLSLSSDKSTGTTADPSAASVPLDGTWKITNGSQAGYRVNEVLFGSNHAAVGRTTAVTGDATINGTKVTAASVNVDLSQVSSDQTRRDNQFRGRIMDVSSFPTSTFKLTQPIDLPSTTGRVTTKAKGDFTARGVTKPVSADVQAERSGTAIRGSGSTPGTFADWNIPNPSFGPITTEDHGLVEF